MQQEINTSTYSPPLCSASITKPQVHLPHQHVTYMDWNVVRGITC